MASQTRTMMNFLRSLFLILLLAFPAVAEDISGSQSKKPLKVYILAGQSNMQGSAHKRTFGAIGDDPGTAEILNDILDAKGEPIVCDNAWVTYMTGDRDGDIVLNGKLKVGYGFDSERIGPEYGFGIFMSKALDEPILIIKTAWGGKSLAIDYRPPSAGPYNPSEIEKQRGNIPAEEQVGHYYRQMIRFIKATLKDPESISKVVPGYNAKQGYELSGFVWFQGWNDMCNRHHTEQYTDNMIHFIGDVRKELDTPKLPFIVGILGVYGTDPDSRKFDKGLPVSTFRKAQFAAVEQYDQKVAERYRGNVVAVDSGPYYELELSDIYWKKRLSSYWKQSVKQGKMTPEKLKEEFERYGFGDGELTAVEQRTWDRCASNAEYHYLGSGKTFVRFGKALADAMLKMEENKPAAGTKNYNPEPKADYPYTPTPFSSVQVDGGFWGPRMATNQQVTVRYCFDKCEQTGRIDNFAIAGGLKEGGFTGIYFNDSDVFKVIEGAAYSLQMKKDEKLDRYLDELIAKIAAAQEDDGYLYTARTINDPKYNYPGRQARWSHLGHGHELYNVGHMYEAAAAHYQATGKRSLLDVAIKNADLICETFGPDEKQLKDVPGHEEIEIGLVKLYRLTGNEKYLMQAKFFIDMRGRKDLRGNVYGTYAQDHIPLIEQTEAVGHAVRGGYLYAGVADVAALTGNKAYVQAIDRIWQDVMDCKVYITGSVGQHGAGEGYAGAWKLDNLKAYNETCASIALALWNHRMFLLHGDSKYIDELERTLYNGFLSGVSLSGDRFFYPNPLACDMKFKFNNDSLERSPWFGCSCCPVNVVRFLPSVTGMIYAHHEDAAYVNLFVNGTGKIQMKDRTVNITQLTDYPWSGKIKLIIKPEKPCEFALHVRIPGWAADTAISSDLYRIMPGCKMKWKPVWSVNGKVQSSVLKNGYAVIRHTWKAGDVVELDLPMQPQRILAHDNIKPDQGRTAVMRGPVVYCIEGADHDGKALNIALDDDAVLSARHRPDLLGGVTVLTGKGIAANRQEDGSISTIPIDLTMIPYYAWCHRGANPMQVWLPRKAELAQVAPLPTIASTSKASSSYSNGGDSANAINDQQEPARSGDHSIPRHTWWDHKGTGEWVQYDFDKTHKVSSVDVYWFDDSGQGQCRVPKGWRVLYKKGDQWQPVHTQEWLHANIDQFDHAEFEPITTDGLRIEVQLQPNYSGGILEWRVNH